MRHQQGKNKALTWVGMAHGALRAEAPGEKRAGGRPPPRQSQRRVLQIGENPGEPKGKCYPQARWPDGGRPGAPKASGVQLERNGESPRQPWEGRTRFRKSLKGSSSEESRRTLGTEGDTLLSLIFCVPSRVKATGFTGRHPTATSSSSNSALELWTEVPLVNPQTCDRSLNIHRMQIWGEKLTCAQISPDGYKNNVKRIICII